MCIPDYIRDEEGGKADMVSLVDEVSLPPLPQTSGFLKQGFIRAISSVHWCVIHSKRGERNGS